MIMNTGHFYYINDQYFIDFPDPMLMRNKEAVNGQAHNRPCFYAFKEDTTGLYWMIPISSQVAKFKTYYNAKVQRYGKCDTLAFGEVLGFEKAFLIQNMCPITEQYILNEYVDKKANLPVRINGAVEQELIAKAKKVLALYRRGIKLLFADIEKIEKELLK